MLIIDVQGFTVNKEARFVPKELSATNGDESCHYVFKAPFPFKRLSRESKDAVKHLTRNKHGLRWDYGHVDLEEIPFIFATIAKRENVIYCKGPIKAQFIRSYTKVTVVDLDTNPCISKLPAWKPLCFSHVLNKCSCTCNNVNYLLQFLTTNDVL